MVQDGTPLGTPVGGKAPRRGRLSAAASGRAFVGVFAGPLAVWQGLFFLAPLVFMVVMTFWSVRNYQLSADLTLANWQAILAADYVWDAFARSFLGAALAAVSATVIAFPCAYYLGLKTSTRLRLLGACLIMAPFFTSFLVRAYTWRTMLGDEGVVNAILSWVGLGPVIMINNLFGSVVGYLTLVMPLVLLLQLFSIAAIDRRLIEAAHNLGCGPVKTVFRVVIPAARNGIVLAAAFAFVLSFGDLISPQVLGGSNPPTLSLLIVDQVRGGLQWPKASVIAVMMVVTLVLVVSAAMAFAYGRAARRSGGG